MQVKQGRPLAPLREQRPQGMTREELAHWCLAKAVPSNDGKGCLNLDSVARHPGGYPKVSDGSRGWKSMVMAGHLVLEMHHGPKPERGVMRHLCHNPLCINPEHLRWGSQKENIYDTMRNERHGRMPVSGAPKLRVFDVRCIRELARMRMPHRKIGERFGITQSMVSRIHLRKSWAHV